MFVKIWQYIQEGEIFLTSVEALSTGFYHGSCNWTRDFCIRSRDSYTIFSWPKRFVETAFYSAVILRNLERSELSRSLPMRFRTGSFICRVGILHLNLALHAHRNCWVCSHCITRQYACWVLCTSLGAQ